MTEYRTLNDIDGAGQTILLRADLNVPFKDGRVTDSTRLNRLAPTLEELSAKGAKTIIMSHFGRPKGQVVPEMSLRPVAEELSAILGKPVAFADDCIGPAAEQAAAALEPGGFLVLENLRFHPEEEANDEGFAAQLAKLGDLYVNDAFSAAHRAHASTEALAKLLPAHAGRLMEAEIDALTKALEKPERPVMAVVGGAKISTKLELLGNLVKKVDKLVLGGGMANTFLFAAGLDVGASLCEKDMAETAQDIMAKADASGCEIILPTDVIVAEKLEEGIAYFSCPVTDIPADKMILDIGPDSIVSLKSKIDFVKTVVWNGPLGVFEVPPFDDGTNEIARHVAKKTDDRQILSVAGGGDTVSALANAGVTEDFSYISAAGGAFLEWLEGKELPGVAVLLGKRKAA